MKSPRPSRSRAGRVHAVEARHCVALSLLYNGSMEWFKKLMASQIGELMQEPTPEESLRALVACSADKARQKKLAHHWRDRSLRSYQVTPGTAATRNEFMAEMQAQHQNGESRERAIWVMSGKECKVFLTSVLGAPSKIEADVGTCHLWSFDFEGSTFIANWRSSKGLGWEWVDQELMEQVDEENCRSYGRPVLLSHDKEAPAAWGRFCKSLTRAYALGPERAKSLLEAFEIEAVVGKPSANRKSLRC